MNIKKIKQMEAENYPYGGRVEWVSTKQFIGHDTAFQLMNAMANNNYCRALSIIIDKAHYEIPEGASIGFPCAIETSKRLGF